MERKEIILTKLLSAAIRKQKFIITEEYKEIDWNEIYDEAVEHNVQALIFPTVNEICDRYRPEDELLAGWKNDAMFAGINMLKEINRMSIVINKLQNAGIELVALKGVAINSLYPYPELRSMGDADLLIHEKDFEKAEKILSEMGYCAEKDKETKHIEFLHQEFMCIELHRRLIEYDFVKNIEKFERIVWDNLVEARVLNTKTLALEWENQVVYLCLHMASHTIFGGFGLRQLCDLVLVTELKRTDIDWNKVLKKAEEFGAEKLVYALFSACKKLFDMEIPCEMERKIEANEKCTNKLISDIFSSGSFGNKDKARESANLIMKNSGENMVSGYTKLAKIISLLFPSREKLAQRYKYKYVKKNPILTPVAWSHRIIYGIFRRDYPWDLKASLFYDDSLVQVAQERDDLLRWMGLR